MAGERTGSDGHEERMEGVDLGGGFIKTKPLHCSEHLLVIKNVITYI